MTLAFDAIEAAVIDRLNALPAVTNIANAIRSDVLQPRDRYPFVVVEAAVIEPEDDLVGFDGWVNSTVRVRCFSYDKGQSRLLEYATRHGRIDNLGDSDGLIDWDGATIDGQTVDECNWIRSETDVLEPFEADSTFVYETTGIYSIRSGEPTVA